MIVVDTHVLIWTVEDNVRLGGNAREMIAQASGTTGVRVSDITPWEIAMLAQKGRLALGQDVGIWIDAALALTGIRLAPVTPAIAVDSVRLPGVLHPDPADRLIIATARSLGLPLLTADKAVLDYGSAGHVIVSDATL